jgi:two-component system cell cycle sensor histidine kinase/response regulator CckA
MSPLLQSMLVQGAGGLCLVLICCALYVYRRRTYFLYWTLAWLCFSEWLLLGVARMYWKDALLTAPSFRAFLQDVSVCGVWLHMALWGLGIAVFWRGSAVGARWVAASLAAAILVGIFLSRLTTAWAADTTGAAAFRRLADSTCLALVYGASSVLFIAAYRRLGIDETRRPAALGRMPASDRPGSPRAFGVLLLAALFAAYAFEQCFYSAVALGLAHVDRSNFLSYIDFILQALIAVGMVLVLLDEEQSVLHEALRRLGESEDRFRIIFEHSGVGMALLGADGRFVQVNPALGNLLGYAPDELHSRNLTALGHPADATRIIQNGVQPGNGATNYEREKRYLRKDGSTLWARVSRVPVNDEAGRLRYLVGVLVDITERHAAEEALRHERDFTRQVLETAGALIVVLDPQGKVVRFNGKCSAVTGYTEGEVCGRLMWDVLLPPAHVERVKQAFQQAPAGPLPTAFEIPWLTKRGEERLISWRISTARDEQGRLRYVIVSGLDVTEQRSLEEQLRQTQKMEMLGRLVGGIAHDFNNQLTVILGNLQMLTDRLAKDALQTPSVPPAFSLTGALADAANAAQRCADMTRALLMFSSRHVLAMHPLDPNKLVTEAVRVLERLLPAGIQLELDLAAGLGPVKGDRTQLQQALINLTLNARDAMPDGGTLRLETGRRRFDPGGRLPSDLRPGDFVELAVRDTGFGMTPDIQARLFEPFFTTKETGKGTGLGLAMVFGIIRAHDGWIDVQSEPGRGSTFRICLPLLPAANWPTEPEPLASVPTQLPPAPADDTHTVLVVDDEDLVRGLARAVLLQGGFRVLAAADGKEALKLFDNQAEEISVVLLDYTMPGMNGLEVLQGLRQRDPHVRVIFSSGYAMDSDANRLLEAGAKAFVPKPYRPADLLRAVRDVLRMAPV